MPNERSNRLYLFYRALIDPMCGKMHAKVGKSDAGVGIGLLVGGGYRPHTPLWWGATAPHTPRYGGGYRPHTPNKSACRPP